MCGINLIIDRSKNISEEVITKMNAATHHRGPDYTGVKRIETPSAVYYLGHNRLKILDLSADGNQPMSDPTDRYHLIFNGEIYNYQAKRQELKLKPKSQTDTEVLLNWLIEFGVDKVGELQGMFTFAFLDAQEDKLIIARGGTGQKPLYYSKNDSYTLFSSEIRGIMASGLVEKKVNAKGTPHFMTYKYFKRPNTIYEDVLECEPGKYLKYKEGIWIENEDFALPRKKDTDKHKANKIVQEVEDLLLESVEKHLQGDVPIALLLSGGVDSTLLLSLLNTLGKTPIDCYCITGSARRKSFLTEDLPYAVTAARQYGGKLKPITVSDKEFKEEYLQFVSEMDQPIADSAAFLTWKLCKKVNEEDRVLLSGAGADELFGGYNRHAAYWFYIRRLHNKGYRRTLLSYLSELFPEGRNTVFRKQFRLMNKFNASIDKDPEMTFKNFSSLQFPKIHDKEWAQKGNYMNQALKHDFKYYMTSDILSINDKMGMIASKEIRAPYLFQPLVEYMHNLPPEIVMSKGRKWILNSLLKKRGGAVYTKRHKEGFGLPFGDWFKEDMYYADTILKNDSKLNNLVEKDILDSVKEMVLKHQRGKKDYTTELWALFHLATWLEAH